MNTFEADFEAEKEKMMAFMQRHDEFTRKEVLDHVGGPTSRRKNFLVTLRTKGLLRLTRRVGTVTYLTVKDPSEMAVRAAEKRKTPEGAMWTSIRVMKHFTLADVVTSLCSTDNAVSEVQVQKYCSSLLAAGYLKVTLKARPAQKRPAQYMLIKDSGPLPPRVKRMQVVVDENSDKVVHVHGARL